jgi:hypothetical protein
VDWNWGLSKCCALFLQNDLEQFVEQEVKNYIEPLRIPKFVSSHLKRHRRDDDGMPNYLDHYYGGLGEYIPK